MARAHSTSQASPNGAADSWGGSGVTNANGGLMISTDTFLGLSNVRSLNSAGPATWLGPFNLINSTSTRLVNLPSASFAIETSSDFSNGAFINQGTLTKKAGSGDGETRFSGALSNSGLRRASNPACSTLAGGDAETNSSITRLSGGDVTASTPIAINGGRFEGSGTISAPVVSAGEITPGLADDPSAPSTSWETFRRDDRSAATASTSADRRRRLRYPDDLRRRSTRRYAGDCSGRRLRPNLGDTFEVMSFASAHPGVRRGDRNYDRRRR